MIDCKTDCPEYKRLAKQFPWLKPHHKPHMSSDVCAECVLEQRKKAEDKSRDFGARLLQAQGVIEMKDRIIEELRAEIKERDEHDKDMAIERNLLT